ncbi:MAG: hypothetical protein K2Q15_17735, partial [Burkholderiales bacterium]|nr:hypothetical protein [Burkholderiales bacterium]
MVGFRRAGETRLYGMKYYKSAGCTLPNTRTTRFYRVCKRFFCAPLCCGIAMVRNASGVLHPIKLHYAAYCLNA